jgi:hypothetical protein
MFLILSVRGQLHLISIAKFRKTPSSGYTLGLEKTTPGFHTPEAQYLRYRSGIELHLAWGHTGPPTLDSGASGPSNSM